MGAIFCKSLSFYQLGETITVDKLAVCLNTLFSIVPLSMFFFASESTRIGGETTISYRRRCYQSPELWRAFKYLV